MWLKRHDEVEETRSVDRFTSAMHTLSRRDTTDEKRYVLMPTRARAHEVHVSGASEGRRPSRRPVAPRQSAAATAAQRRRRTLIGLVGAAVLTIVLAVVLGGIAIWAMQLIVDGGLVAFVLHLRNRARQAALVRPRRRPAPRYAARVEPEYEDSAYEAADDFTAADEFKPVPVRYVPTAAAHVFDQTALEEDQTTLEEVGEPEPLPVAGGSMVFDQDAQPERMPDPVPAVAMAVRRDEFFDQDLAPVVVRPAARKSEAAPVPVGEEIGARPWEPIPVPKPVYASKPAAPARPKRAPLFEPLLPPIESLDELDPVEDLEEILDRRWAVND
jgi:hypothetical protein